MYLTCTLSSKTSLQFSNMMQHRVSLKLIEIKTAANCKLLDTAYGSTWRDFSKGVLQHIIYMYTYSLLYSSYLAHNMYAEDHNHRSCAVQLTRESRDHAKCTDTAYPIFVPPVLGAARCLQWVSLNFADKE